MTRRIRLPFKIKNSILALGADLKGAFAIASGREAVLVDGFGDLGEIDNFTNYEKAVKSHLKRLKIRPQIIACDLHPGYFSTRFAEDYTLYTIHSTLIKVQHHEAHIASAIVDNDIKGNVIGVALDGTGYGYDGRIWGGEFFVGDLKTLRRAGHFEYIPMPGGDKAVMEPWRMAASYLSLLKKSHPRLKRYPVISKMILRGVNSPLTSSAGRLFDAVGSLVLCKETAKKEAELPMELERIADPYTEDAYRFDIKKYNGLAIMDLSKVIKGVMADISAKRDRGIISAKFHNTIARIIRDTAIILSRKHKMRKVVLSGGVFQNRFLTARTVAMLEARGLKVYLHSAVSTNDSGIPIGQVAIANMRARCA